MKNELERQILRVFFKRVSTVEDINSEISESKIVRTAQSQLKKALRNMQRCTCNKCKYTICEVCQASDKEMVFLRNFYNNIRNAKKNNMSSIEIQEFINNTNKSLSNS